MTGTTQPKRSGPKPRGPFSNKRRTFTTRIQESTRQSLEHAAFLSNRSLSQEAEFRLMQSIAGDEPYGDAELSALLRMFAGAVAIIEKRSDKSWADDWETALAARQALNRLMALAGPDVPRKYLDAVAQPDLPAMPEASPVKDPMIHLGKYLGRMDEAPPLYTDEELQQRDRHTKALLDRVRVLTAHCDQLQVVRKQIANLDTLGVNAALAVFPKSGKDDG